MLHGDSLVFKIDWAANEMQLREVGPALQRFFKESERQPVAITPTVHALECLTNTRQQENPPYHFLLDVTYDRESAVVRVHCTDDYAALTDVPRERLTALLRPLLTPRETEIASLLFEGRTIRCIASLLRITEGTVKRTIYNIYRKMNLGSQVELVREIYARLAQAEPIA